MLFDKSKVFKVPLGSGNRLIAGNSLALISIFLFAAGFPAMSLCPVVVDIVSAFVHSLPFSRGCSEIAVVTFVSCIGQRNRIT